MKCDLVPRNLEKGVARRVEDACRKWLDDWVATGEKTNPEPGVSVTSCKPKKPWQVKDAMLGGKGWPCAGEMGVDVASTKILLYRITDKSEDDGFRGPASTIPCGWFIAQGELDAMAEGRYGVLDTVDLECSVRKLKRAVGASRGSWTLFCPHPSLSFLTPLAKQGSSSLGASAAPVEPFPKRGDQS